MKKLKNNKGITLIEVLISMAIISMLGIGFFSTLNSTTRINIKNDKDLKAMDIAQSEIEKISKEIKKGSNTIELEDGKNIDLNSEDNVISESYTKKHDSKDNYLVGVIINKEEKIQEQKKYFLYKVEVNAQSKSHFTDREVTLTTYVLERF